MAPTALLVDDEADNRELYARFLEERAAVSTAASAEEAVARLEQTSFDVVVTDLRMPGRSGTELAAEVAQRQPLCSVLLVTAHADLESAIAAVRLGVVEYLRKPVRRAELLRAFDRALERGRLLRSLQREQERDPDLGLGRLLGNSPAMERLRATIVRVQNTDASVLVIGETGTGKELVARSIHEGSHRADGPFMAVNCAALSPELLESELFGHEKGAYTGAQDKAVGLLEAASGGTLFLDEIGECPLPLQAKLLRALQEREVMPVGGREARPIDIRVVAATHRELRDEVAAGRFREDLFFRLEVFPIRTPPLRDIPEDMPVLATTFARQQAARLGVPPRDFDPAVHDELARRPWPGNVRQLENLVARLVILAQGERYTLEDLATAEGMDGPPPAPRAATAPGAPMDLATLLATAHPPPLEEVERAYILGMLARCGGKRTEAARLLGIHRVTLNRKLERWDPGADAPEAPLED